ncbi:MAG: (2Fe-2S)-binding protein [Rhodospirillaceae bacterium]
MFVCNCNGITEKQAKAVIQPGIRFWDDVDEAYGCEPRCGKCQCDITHLVMEVEAETTAGPSPLFGGTMLEGAD